MSLPLRIFSPVSRLATRSRRRALERGRLAQRAAPLPVVSVGNIAFGGSGKTPLALSIMEDLRRAGRRPAFVSRGYKGEWERPGGVVSSGRGVMATWREAGDEPFMVARAMPSAGVFVGRDRLASCLRAREAGFDVAVLDDAFQHLRLGREIDVVLYDPESQLPLRESPSALRRAGAVLVPRSAGREAKSRLVEFLGGVPVFDYAVEPLGLAAAVGSIAPSPTSEPQEAAENPREKGFSPRMQQREDVGSRDRPQHVTRPAPESESQHRKSDGGLGSAADATPALMPESLHGRPVVAVCGIARPERFFAMLESIGLTPAARLAFPDHHAYPLASRARIARAAAEPAAGNRVSPPASASNADASNPKDAAGQPAGGPVIVTTEKDLPKLEGAPELAGVPLFALQIRLDVAPGLFDLIRSALGI